MGDGEPSDQDDEMLRNKKKNKKKKKNKIGCVVWRREWKKGHNCSRFRNRD